MATAKQIQEYILEHGEGWKQFGSQCAKLDSPNFCKAILFSKSGFDVWSTHATIADSISQEELDFLTLTQAIQLINEKTGDNIPLPKERNNMEERFHNKNLYLVAFICVAMTVLWLVLG